MNSKQVGEKSEAKVLSKFLDLGWIVLIPFGDNQRYDLVIDRGDNFERVQVKTGKLKNGVITFPTASSYAHRGGKRRNYLGECDLFACYCPDNNKVYLLNVNDCPTNSLTLRLIPTKNGQSQNIVFAKDFEI